ncbi:MAG: hypothetical protein LAT77_10555 [Aliidiomarina sp.]|uniref:hypothetical protein n=1 Tax=Aliidiomarina sp. TaxID=1872439 RepID=UPI0025B8257B|nr:hypothetical protein [Aliidiomarina sp.]MCH8502335.1 hypothetical protein [Aliidiomarina sp.]
MSSMQNGLSTSDKIKALILTYDKQIGLAQLLIKKYRQLEMADVLSFVVPINGQDSIFSVDAVDIEFIQSDSDILSTMHALLSGFADDDWIFWAIDDRYPLTLDAKSFLEITQYLSTAPANINGIKLLHWREKLTTDAIKIGETRYFLQEVENTFGLWHHHFLRAKVLKSLFLRENSQQLNNITAINEYFCNSVPLSFLEGIYVPERPIATLGEPLYQGKLTLNGKADLIRYDCRVPEYPVIERCMAFYDGQEQIELNPSAPKVVPSDFFKA